jgi:ABC-type lipoprotein release transport system permease subunit
MNRKLIFTALLFAFCAVMATADEAELMAEYEEQQAAFYQKWQETYLSAITNIKKDNGWKPDLPIGEYNVIVMWAEWYELVVMAGVDKARFAHISDYAKKIEELKKFERELQVFIASFAGRHNARDGTR